MFGNNLPKPNDGLATEMSHIKSGVLDGKPVVVVVDTVSHMSVVQADLVGKTKLKEETAKLEYVNSDSTSYPMAQITLNIGDWSKKLSVTVVLKLPADVLISWKDY